MSQINEIISKKLQNKDNFNYIINYYNNLESPGYKYIIDSLSNNGYKIINSWLNFNDENIDVGGKSIDLFLDRHIDDKDWNIMLQKINSIPASKKEVTIYSYFEKETVIEYIKTLKLIKPSSNRFSFNFIQLKNDEIIKETNSFIVIKY